MGSGVMGSSDGFESKKLGRTIAGRGGIQSAWSRQVMVKTACARRVFRRTRSRDGCARDSSYSAANLVEISGVIKWFDALGGLRLHRSRQWLAGWVLLHACWCYGRDGFQTAYEGARIVVECVQRAKGYQAFRIVSMDESTAIHPAQMLPPRTHVSVTPTSGLERAQVKWFNRLRGFGFLSCGRRAGYLCPIWRRLRRLRHDSSCGPGSMCWCGSGRAPRAWWRPKFQRGRVRRHCRRTSQPVALPPRLDGGATRSAISLTSAVAPGGISRIIGPLRRARPVASGIAAIIGLGFTAGIGCSAWSLSMYVVLGDAGRLVPRRVADDLPAHRQYGRRARGRGTVTAAGRP